MADSKNKSKKSSLHTFEDDLDAMFEESDFLDDAPMADDALDRLLLDDSFENSKSLMDEADDIDKLFESAEPKPPIPKTTKEDSPKHAKQDIDTLLDNVNEKPVSKKAQNDADVFAEIDDFDEFASFDAELDELSVTQEAEKPTEARVTQEDDFDEFAMFDEDFDQIKPTNDTPAIPESKAALDSQPEISSTPTVSEDEPIEADDAFDLNFADAFSELDDISESEARNETKAINPEPEQFVAATSSVPSIDLEQSNEEQQEDDFLIADFDISSDDEFDTTTLNPGDRDIDASIDAGIEASPSATSEMDSLQDAFSELDDFLEDDIQSDMAEPAMAAISQFDLPSSKNPPESSDQSELLAQISALWAAQDLLKQQFAATATAMGPSETVASELDLLAKEQKSLRQLMEHNTKKTPGIVYGGIAVGTLALLLGGGLLAMHFKTQAEFQALQEQNSLLQKELAGFKGAGAAHESPEDVKSIAQQMKQIQEKLAALDKTEQIDALQASVAGMKVDMNNLIKKGVELNAQAVLTSAAKTEHLAKVEHADESEHKHEQKPELEHKVEAEHKPEPEHKPEVEHKLEAEHKTESEHKAEHQHGAHPEHKPEAHAETKSDTAPAPVEKSHAAVVEPVAVAKTPEPVAAVIEKAPVKPLVEKPPEKAKPPVRVTRRVAETEQKPKIKPKPVVVQNEALQQSGRWNANLVSFRQDWYAQRKAAEFAQKGIRVSVIPVEVKGETWYRLRAGGFTNRAEANSYAAKAKRQLNLTSVWVTEE